MAHEIARLSKEKQLQILREKANKKRRAQDVSLLLVQDRHRTIHILTLFTISGERLHEASSNGSGSCSGACRRVSQRVVGADAAG